MAGAKHAACTVEMASVARPVDVAVVDEIQMVADSSRGHSFTRAILGIPAQTLHLCGDRAALPLLQQLVQDTGGIIAPFTAISCELLVYYNSCLSGRDELTASPSCRHTHPNFSTAICPHMHDCCSESRGSWSVSAQAAKC